MATLNFNYLKILLIFFGLYFCSSKSNQENTNNCDLIKQIVVSKQIRNYLHEKLQNRNVLYLVRNEFCNENFQINKLKIVVVEKNNVVYENVLFLENILKSEKLTTLNFYYPIEGLHFSVILKDKSIIEIKIFES